MMKQVIIGAHHKTGTVLAVNITKIILDFLPHQPETVNRVYEVPNSLRNIPISHILRNCPKSSIIFNMWFENRVDVSGIKFLHFLREPMSRIASAYLYHKRGAPSDRVRWADWQIFDLDGPKSYVEVINALNMRDALIVEAIRTYPEALGSARAYESASTLPSEENLPVWLHRFEDDPTEVLTTIFKFMCGETDDRLDAFLAKAKAGNIILDDSSVAKKSGHITRDDADRQAVEEAIAGSAPITHLYGDIMRKIGSVPTLSRAESGERQDQPLAEDKPERSAEEKDNASDIVRDIKSKDHILSINALEIQRSEKFWKDPVASSIWQTLALSNFGNGHLMMQPFIQRFLSQLA